MSGNKLLAENTIRRFMKLANVETMTDNFVTEMYGKKFKDDEKEELEETKEEELEEGGMNYKDDDDEDIKEEIDALYEEEEDEEDFEDEEEDMEMDLDAEDPELDAEPEIGAADMSLTEEEAQLLVDLGRRLETALGGEEGEDDMGDMEDMEDMGAPEMDAPADEEDEELMQEALVNEVLKRVTKRIVAAKLQNRK